MAEDIRSMENTSGNKAFEKQYKAPYCILLDSGYCSMGRMIGNIACKKAGYNYYDAVILLEEVPEEDLAKEDVDLFETTLRTERDKEEILNDPKFRHISDVFEKAVKKALEKGPCLIHDRATSEMIEKLGYSSISVLTYATNKSEKIERAKLSPIYKDLEDSRVILKKIEEEDCIRYNYHKALSETEWGNKESYDVCLNTDELGRDFSAELLAKLMGA